MAKGTSREARWAPTLLSVLRMVAALVFMEHGTQKLFGFPGGPRMGNFDPLSLMGIAGMLETFGGALLALGIFTRPVAFILSGQMAVAYFKMHAPQGFWPVLNQGELAVLYCFLFLYFAAAGGGPWSVDAMRRRR
jgi:putative oxidoreductase